MTDPHDDDDRDTIAAWVTACVIALCGLVVYAVNEQLCLWNLPTVSIDSNESPTLLGSDWVDHEPQGESLVANRRSSKWPTVRARFIASNGDDGWPNDRCAVCGTTVDLNVHHIESFANAPHKELDPGNLVTLCRLHHLHVGHDPDLGGPIRASWSRSNPNVREDAKRMRDKLNPQGTDD